MPSDPDEVSQQIASRLSESARLNEEIARRNAGEIQAIARLIIDACRRGGKVVLFGNGGSAADAQHIAETLMEKSLLKGQAFPAIALTTNTSSILTAIADDCNYDEVFSRQVAALVTDRDVVIGISTSGDSQNVMNAIELAKKRGAKTIGLTGGSGGRLARVAEITLIVPSDCTPRIQEAHITIGHIICELL
jgi:D-sedoheptulose 7-phosphate isomerase